MPVTVRIVRVEPDGGGLKSRRKLGIGVVHRIGDALDILDQATLAQTNPACSGRIASMVGWK